MTTSRVTLNNKNLSSHSSGGWKSKIKVWAGVVPSEGSKGESVPGLAPGWHLVVAGDLCHPSAWRWISPSQCVFTWSCFLCVSLCLLLFL